MARLHSFSAQWQAPAGTGPLLTACTWTPLHSLPKQYKLLFPQPCVRAVANVRVKVQDPDFHVVLKNFQKTAKRLDKINVLFYNLLK